MSPGEPDRAVVRRHLMALDRALEILRKSQGLSIGALERDLEKLWAVEHGLQICTQNVLDVATHIASAAGRDPSDYAEAIDHLAELEILPRDFASRFRAVAGFRNVLVHGYLEVDVGVVHRLLNERLEDFVDFARFVAAHLEQDP